MLDNHGDMTGTANCGNGAPMWFQQKVAGDLIGKPLTTGFPCVRAGVRACGRAGVRA